MDRQRGNNRHGKYRERWRGSLCGDTEVEKRKGVFRELNWVLGPKQQRK